MDVAPNTGIGPRRTPAAPDDPNAKSGYAQTFLALTALGVVFGDIGTSPLYAFSVALKATGKAPTTEHVLGVVSLTFWALMLIISLKYVAIVMRADNDGEGGLLALLSLVEHQDPPAQRARLSIVVLLGIVGAALPYGDGVITPAISVLSAMEGIKFSPAAADFIVPITLVILVGLFALQYRGTGSVGRLFGPVMVVWFVAIGVLGIVNIWAAPAILHAFNPQAVRLATASPFTLFLVLGGVFLALTGGEALYAEWVMSAVPRSGWRGLGWYFQRLSFATSGRVRAFLSIRRRSKARSTVWHLDGRSSRWWRWRRWRPSSPHKLLSPASFR